MRQNPLCVTQPRSSTLTIHELMIERAIMLMHERYRERLELADLARAAHMSTFHFDRVFSKVTGVSPRRFLSAMRIEASKRLLLSNSETVTNICLDVGFSSLGTFSSHFRGLVGMSPSRFRLAASRFDSHVLTAMTNRIPTLIGATQGRMRVHVSCDVGTPQLVFVGLFEGSVPTGSPIECGILSGEGELLFSGTVHGTVFAIGFERIREVSDLLLPDSRAIMIGQGCARQGASQCPLALDLQRPSPLSPPLLTPVALLFTERFLK